MENEHVKARGPQGTTGLESSEGAEQGGLSMAPPAFQISAGTPFQFQRNGGGNQGIAQFSADTGNTELVTQITTLLAAPTIDAAGATDVMQTFGFLSEDRIRVVLLQLRTAGKLGPFRLRVMPAAGAGFATTSATILKIASELTNPLAGTVAADAADRTAVAGILNEGLNVNAQTGQVAAFIDVVNGKSYQADILETLTREVAALYPRAVQRNARPRHAWQPYEVIAREAKEATDALYGAYNVAGAPMTSSGPTPNLRDVRDQSYNNSSLAQFANYLVTGHNPINPVYPGQRIHGPHNADLNRTTEADILRQAITTWMSDATHLNHLLELRRGWSGVQSGGTIFIQRWDMGNEADNRRQFWSMFQTMIHEYLHKITHPTFSTAARRLGRQREQVFTEGGTSYFDKRVWQSIFPQEIASNATLRQDIEGAAYPYDPAVIPAHHGYAQMGQFERISNQVGEENAKAAYFKGEVDKIGMPTA
jgi:hypothetical protein